jgi:hypothetical protein
MIKMTEEDSFYAMTNGNYGDFEDYNVTKNKQFLMA